MLGGFQAGAGLRAVVTRGTGWNVGSSIWTRRKAFLWGCQCHRTVLPERLESPSLEIFKTHLDALLFNLLSETWSSFQPLVFCRSPLGQWILWFVTQSFLSSAGADKKAEAGAGAATEFQFVSICIQIGFLCLCSEVETQHILYLRVLGMVLISNFCPLHSAALLLRKLKALLLWREVSDTSEKQAQLSRGSVLFYMTATEEFEMWQSWLRWVHFCIVSLVCLG